MEVNILNEIRERALTDPGFKEELKKNPKKVLKENWGVDIRDDVEVNVVENSTSKLYILLPLASEMSEEELAQLAGGAGRDFSSGGSGYQLPQQGFPATPQTPEYGTQGRPPPRTPQLGTMFNPWTR